MVRHGAINPCRPGYGASCAICCGSHNYALSRDRIENLFMERGAAGTAGRILHPKQVLFERVVPDAMQCPHVGMQPDEPGIVSCLIYVLPWKGKSVESFFQGTCRTFFCRGYEELTDEEIIFAAKLMRDWYYYPLLINRVDVLRELCAEYACPEDVPAEVLASIISDLDELAWE